MLVDNYNDDILTRIAWEDIIIFSNCSFQIVPLKTLILHTYVLKQYHAYNSKTIHSLKDITQAAVLELNETILLVKGVYKNV